MLISSYFSCPKIGLSGTCPGTYDQATFKYITSPNYPENYGNNDDCSWMITALRERFFVLNITDFDTEYNDVLVVYNGSNDKGIRLERRSGFYSYQSEIMFTGKNMYLKFTSDYYSNKKGFRILLNSYGKYK